MNRRAYIDWLRGLAVVIMIEAHTIDAWTVTDPAVRSQATFKFLQFLAGWAAPLFLFLAGVSVSMAAASHLRKGKSVAEASAAVQRRGWQILGLAFLFRVQSFMLSPTQPIAGLLKVDILNIMGLAMVAAAWCWGRGRSDRERTLWLLVPSAAIVIIGQFTPGWSWPDVIAGPLEGYMRLIEGTGNFMLAPWSAFVLVGAWLGRLLLVNRDATADKAFHLRLGLIGAAILALALVSASLPEITPHSVYWQTSTSFVLLRLGVMSMLLSLAWLWMQRPRATRWSPMVLFGQTSLFVYWVHVEIVYGFPTYPIRHEFSIARALEAYAVFTLLMLWLAVKWNQRAQGPLIPVFLKAGGPEGPPVHTRGAAGR